MTKVSAASQKRSSYSSESMARRRTRVLEEARKLIAESGYDGVTMRLLAERSEVASATLYNIYGNKETVIATAVSELFEEQMAHDTAERGAGLDGTIARMRWIAEEIRRMPEYSRAMVTVYFSASAENLVRDLLRRITMQAHRRLFASLREQGGLLPWVDIDLLASQTANHQYAAVHDWAIGKVAMDRLADRQIYELLLALAAVTTGDIADDVRTRLRQVQETLVS
ncbi:TetR/AcrR family transcriptional regulator [Emcibacter sp. SYSU 3D8]|uniref:TetR/AcrR family transcriptional regulator n=1 Tax=Emcibacter sp. SYSU 3D8 TaxID=3133969 RepID=UPI0031FEFD40